MRWTDIEAEQPRLAEIGREKLLAAGVALLGTIRRDDTPRLSPAEPILWDGDLCFAMGWHSGKVGDLERDPRILVHNIVTKRDGSDGEDDAGNDQFVTRWPAMRERFDGEPPPKGTRPRSRSLICSSADRASTRPFAALLQHVHRARNYQRDRAQRDPRLQHHRHLRPA